jgi:hypothetical protein
MFLFGSPKTQTKLFVSHLSEPKEIALQEKSIPTKGGILPSSPITTAVLELAPELIEEGLKVVSSAIEAFTKDFISETIVHKNIDGGEHNEIYIPPHIDILRAKFEHNSEDNVVKDAFEEEFNDYSKLKERGLQIELDIQMSQDQKAFYFQPKRYYYIGQDKKGHKIDEINLFFAFVPASQEITDYDKLTFQKIITFKDLENNELYNFKNTKNYDTSYQSPWISSESDKKGAYTMVFKIEERRYAKAWMQSLNGIYKNHEEQLKEKINKEIDEKLKKR